jgi:hypothetical protein
VFDSAGDRVSDNDALVTSQYRQYNDIIKSPAMIINKGFLYYTEPDMCPQYNTSTNRILFAGTLKPHTNSLQITFKNLHSNNLFAILKTINIENRDETLTKYVKDQTINLIKQQFKSQKSITQE